MRKPEKGVFSKAAQRKNSSALLCNQNPLSKQWLLILPQARARKSASHRSFRCSVVRLREPLGKMLSQGMEMNVTMKLLGCNARYQRCNI